MEHLPNSSIESTAIATPIANLPPSIDDAKQRYVRAVVILLWPFSSSTSQCSLLLSEPDFRLRGENGQFKAVFHNGAAEAVAKCSIGIGDTVVLSLDGVTWRGVDCENSVLTRGIGWDLEFGERLLLEVYREHDLLDTIDVRHPNQEAEEQQGVKESVRKGVVRFRSPSPANLTANVWSSPAFARSLTASMIADAEEDGFMLGKGRKRTKFGRLSSEWIYVDSPPSPVKTDADASQDEENEEEGPELLSGQEDDISVSPSSPTRSVGVGPVTTQQVADDELLEAATPDGFSKSPDITGRLDDAEVDHAEQSVELSKPLGMHGITEQRRSVSIELRQASPQKSVSPAAIYPVEQIESQPTSEQNRTDQTLGEPQLNTTPIHEASRFTPTNQEHVASSAISPSPLHDELKGFREESVVVEVGSGHSSPLPDQDDMLERRSFAAEALAIEEIQEIHSSGSELERGAENDFEEREREPVRPGSLKYSASEVSDDVGSESGFSEISSDGENEMSLNADSELPSSDYEHGDVSEARDILLGQTSYIPQEVIVLDSDDEPATPEDLSVIGGPRGRYDQAEQDQLAEGDVNIASSRAEHDVSKSEELGETPPVESMSDEARNDVDSEHVAQEEDRANPASDRASPQGFCRRGIFISSSSVVEGSPERTDTPVVEPENSPRLCTTPGSHFDNRFPIDPALFLDGAGPDGVTAESLTFSNQQMITPSNTQQSPVTFYQVQTSATHTVQNIPTPEHTQHSLISRQSYLEYATETEPTFNSVLEGSFHAFQPAVTDYREHESPSFIQTSVEPSVEGSVAGQEGTSAQNMDDEAVSHEKDPAPAGSPEPTADTLGSEVETPKRLDSHTDEHTSGLRTKFSYFCPLSLLVGSFNESVDTISVVTSVSPISRASQGPRDYFVTLHITDSSLAGNIVCAQVFCKDKSFLPTCARGDVILLRNLKVGSTDHKMMLSSICDSSWAVFIQGNGESVQVKSAPVEFGDEELKYVAGLRQWYEDDGEGLVGRNTPRPRDSRSMETSSSIAPSESGSVSSRGRGSLYKKYRRKRESNTPRRLGVHELRNGRQYLDAGSPSDKESIHELRDGTVYAHV